MTRSMTRFMGASLVATGLMLAVPAMAQDTSGPILQGPVQAIPGPKRTIAVGQIDAIGALAPPGTAWNVGGSLSAMLSTALQESDRFIVVERNALSQVLNEQQMAANRVSAGTAAPLPGAVIPAQYLVVGSVTEFGTADKGSGVSVGGVGGLLSGALSLSSTKGSVAIDLRIVDTRTSGQVAAFKVKREISSTSVGVTGGYSGISLGGNKFWSTPLGEATRAAIGDAVGQIARAVASGNWQGAVVEAEGDTVYINAGSDIGLKAGDHLTVQRIGKTFTDPTTGAVLAERKAVLGTVELSNVEGKLASGHYVAADPANAPMRGDLAVLGP
jgi:curli biogenesis system outer membrane secretion channel CsgG